MYWSPSCKIQDYSVKCESCGTWMKGNPCSSHEPGSMIYSKMNDCFVREIDVQNVFKILNIQASINRIKIWKVFIPLETKYKAIGPLGI